MCETWLAGIGVGQNLLGKRMDEIDNAVLMPRSHKRLVIAIALCLLFLAAAAILVQQRRKSGFALGLFRDHTTYDAIDIYGDTRFVGVIAESLSQLQEQSPLEYSAIRPYVGRIEQTRRSGSDPSGTVPWWDSQTIYLSTPITSYSQTWTTGTIAHEAHRLYLYRQYVEQNGEPVPDSVWRGPEGELDCLTFQTTVAQNIGSPQFELDYLARLDGTYGDLDGDGEETWLDYWLRDW
jgi:hypothetical protein